MESQTKNKKTRAEVESKGMRPFNGLGLAAGDEAAAELKLGWFNSLRGYGKTTFTPAEEQRNRLYSLDLALVMHVECYYRNYDTDEIFNMSRQFIGATMAWLQAN